MNPMGRFAPPCWHGFTRPILAQTLMQVARSRDRRYVPSVATQADVAIEDYLRCVAFLNHEAELLDDNRWGEWLETVADRAIDYRIPIRVTRERAAGAGFSEGGYHMAARYDTFKVRVARFESEFAWGDDPPSRTRRFVSNVVVENGEGDDAFDVRSNLLVYRSRFDSPDHLLICGRRHDVLTASSGDLRLLKRVVLLDHTTLATGSLGIIL